MRHLNKKECKAVNGGICEGMDINDCLSIGTEIVEQMGHAITRHELIKMLNELGGDLGIWLYNITHDD